MSALAKAETDLKCLAAEIDGVSDLLCIVTDDLEENTINPPRVEMDANAVRQCFLMLSRTADDMRALAKRVADIERAMS